MPDYADSTLTIILPTHQKDSFLEAIKGPEDFPLPLEAFSSFEQPSTSASNHSKLQMIEKLQSGLIPRFKEAMKEQGWPEWMKPSHKDLEVFLTDPDELKHKIVPFSVAKLAPLTREEFETYLPDATPSSDMWSKSPGKTATSSPVINLRMAKIGTKWSPSYIQANVSVNGETTRITIKFQTPWSPLSDIDNIMRDVCQRHDAKFLLTWIEETGSCGYTYLDPASDELPEECNFDSGHKWMKEIEDEDPDFTSTFLDSKAFRNDVVEQIGDPDF